MLTPSDEQQKVIQTIKDGYNVQVDAVAGSGKTTTVLSLADQISEKNIIQLTYNTELKEEVIQKKVKYGETMYLDNLSIYTYHGLAYQFYSTEAKTDIGIHKILLNHLPPRRKLPNIQILVLDEIQDMNELYYTFIYKFIQDLNTPVQLLILGDKNQGLYEFKGADTRFLTLAYQLWPISPFEFKQLQLSTSYRVTKQIAKFVNNIMLGTSRLQAQKEGPNVIYIRNTNQYNLAKIIAYKLVNQIKMGFLKPDDIFILSASVKSERSPVKIIENILVTNQIPCYIPMSETSSINSKIIKHKVIFASFHQSKGRERKMVIVSGFDNNYFKFFNRSDPIDRCPSTLYVAATRSTNTLCLMESEDPLSFLKQTHTQMAHSNYITFEGIPLRNMDSVMNAKQINEIEYIKTSPTDLIKFLNETVLLEIDEIISELFKTDHLSFPLMEVNIQSNIETNYGNISLHEEVYDINGIAIPALFESQHIVNGSNTIKTFIQNFYKTTKNTFYINKIKTIDFDNMTLSDHFKMCTLYMSINENIMFKPAQINHYSWITEKDIHKIFRNMNRHISNPSELIYEFTIIDYKMEEEEFVYQEIDEFMDIHLPDCTKIRLNARVDAISSNTLWEFKCVETLDVTHYLQLMIYAWIWNKIWLKTKGPRIFKIMNIRTSEVLTLDYDNVKIDYIMKQILQSKYLKNNVYSNNEFIEKCKHNVSKI